MSELECELRERELVDSLCFKGPIDQAIDNLFSQIESLRRNELYPHREENCSELCKKRVNYLLVSIFLLQVVTG